MSDSSMTMEELRTFLGFRSLDASNPSILQMLTTVQKEIGKEMKCLPFIDSDANTITYATFQKHFKFAIHVSKAPRNGRVTIHLMVLCLVKFYDIDPEFFMNGACIVNGGLITFPNTEHEASIRLWCSKKVGTNVVYEVTVSSYKGAVPVPMKSDPSKK